MSGEGRKERPLLLALGVLLVLLLVGASIAAVWWNKKRDRERAIFDALADGVQRDLGYFEAVKEYPGDEQVRLASVEKRLREAQALAPRVEHPGEHLDERLRRLEERLAKDRAEWEKSEHDAEVFAEAVTIIRRPGASGYDHAFALLATIDSTSRMAADAATYRQWILADMKVRVANELKKKGDPEAARALLKAALRIKELGPEARASIEKRLAELDAGK